MYEKCTTINQFPSTDNSDMSDSTAQQNDMLQKLFSAGVHYGYSRSRRHPSTEPYIFGVKESIEIIDLAKVEELLEEAKRFVHGLGAEGKTLLLVGGKHEARHAVQHAGERTGLPYVCGRWIGGTLTNFPEIKKRIDRLENLRTRREKGELQKYTKRERLMIDREIAKLEEKFGGLVGMEEVPHAMFVIDSGFEHIAVAEAIEKGLPLIALSNSDCNISNIDYPIVGNDTARASVTFFVEEITRAYEEGRAAKKTAAEEQPVAQQ
jgi:small subunit ribosomal protein S2